MSYVVYFVLLFVLGQGDVAFVEEFAGLEWRGAAPSYFLSDGVTSRGLRAACEESNIVKRSSFLIVVSIYKEAFFRSKRHAIK